MTSTKLILMTVLTTTLLAAGVVGETEKSPSPQPLESVDMPYSSDLALAELESNYDLWLESVLEGDVAMAKLYEKNLLGIVSYDIMRGQEEVRSAAKTAVLASGEKGEESVKKTESTEENLLPASINHLNTKEALYRSLSKTGAFSNKYRLLGDYIGLLRRELKMPKLNLANAEKTSSSDVSDTK